MSRSSEEDQLHASLDGHALANRRRREELRAMSPADKFREIARLMASVSLFDMSRRSKGDTAVRELWQTLRARMKDR